MFKRGFARHWQTPRHSAQLDPHLKHTQRPLMTRHAILWWSRDKCIALRYHRHRSQLLPPKHSLNASNRTTRLPSIP